MSNMKSMVKDTPQPHGYLYGIEDDVLTIQIPFDAKTINTAPVSGKNGDGKSRLLATSRGLLQVDGTPLTISLNVMVPLAK